MAFIHSDVKYTYWNGTINLVAIENGRLKYTGLGPQEMIARFQILEDNQLKLTAAVQLGSKLLLFMGHQYMFYDDLTVENSKKLKEKLMFTNMLFKTREPVTVQTVYFDAKTSNYLFVCSLSYFSVPTSLVDADKSQFYTAIPELTLDNMYSCGAQAQAVLTDEAKWAAIAIMCTLAFILLVVLGVFCQISHRKRRARTRNRPSSSNMRKWSKSNVSSTGSSVASRTSSMVSRSQVASSASSVSGTGSAVASSASRR